ncbi:hypothetical protein RND71_018713 [Anisodus tanguticus]|uniref:Uncharacterized protein n=1 Tax=Anisodus tanguticus TaxID=243964 RepID=A0AAE1VCA9_9SOLA|nr:hypothetical protein RND71_018713 [Anisodus tanguticus]
MKDKISGNAAEAQPPPPSVMKYVQYCRRENADIPTKLTALSKSTKGLQKRETPKSFGFKVDSIESEHNPAPTTLSLHNQSLQNLKKPIPFSFQSQNSQNFSLLFEFEFQTQKLIEEAAETPQSWL